MSKGPLQWSINSALFTVAKKWKQSKYPSTDKWINKMCYIYNMKYFFSQKRDLMSHLQLHGWTGDNYIK